MTVHMVQAEVPLQIDDGVENPLPGRPELGGSPR
jgi:hypothetical protein